MSDKPTLRQIAGILKLSTSTVSKALSGSAEVSDETRKQVIRCAKKIGYRQEPIRRRNPKERDLRVAIVIDETEHLNDRNTFFYDVLTGFRQSAAKMRMEIVIQSIRDEWRQNPESYDAYLRAKKMDGVFISGLRKGDPFFAALKSTQLPTVIIDFTVENLRIGRIGVDNIAGVRLAIDHLVSLGHKKIGFLNGHSLAEVSEERLLGFAASLCMHDIPYHRELVFEGDFTVKCGKAAADYFSRLGVSGVFCASDLMAFGLIQQLTLMGIRVPEDISVVGFDDLEISALSTPKITNIAQDRKHLGLMACAMLLGMINGSPLTHNVLAPSLIIRESTCAHGRPAPGL